MEATFAHAAGGPSASPGGRCGPGLLGAGSRRSPDSCFVASNRGAHGIAEVKPVGVRIGFVIGYRFFCCCLSGQVIRYAVPRGSLPFVSFLFRLSAALRRIGIGGFGRAGSPHDPWRQGRTRLADFLHSPQLPRGWQSLSLASGAVKFSVPVASLWNLRGQPDAAKDVAGASGPGCGPRSPSSAKVVAGASGQEVRAGSLKVGPYRGDAGPCSAGSACRVIGKAVNKPA